VAGSPAIVSESGLSIPATSASEVELVDRLRRGDGNAVATLVEQWSSAMLRLARAYVRDRAAAEEVVQDSWIAVLGGVGRFEGRSSLKTWVFSIVANRAKTAALRERRSVPFSALDDGGDTPVEPERFLAAGDAWAAHWAAPPKPLAPEERLLAGEARERLREAIADLPPGQRAVLTLRDVEGWSADEVCNVLELSETNQRVLLHRARRRVRHALEPYLGEQ
jgi:RNA polymerase sigma-70 factor (ECF subfamily)